MALESPWMIDILDRYGLTGLPTETEYPTGTEGWDSYPVPWGKVLNQNRDRESNPPTADFPQEFVPTGSWTVVGQGIEAAAQRFQHVPPPKDVDALAWYLPFHYFGLDWGIYVKEQSILEVAALIYLEMKMPPMKDRLADDLCRMALSVLYLHEAFHHKVEAFATRLEMANLSPIYRAYKDNVVQSVRGTDDHLEEAVACAEMFSRLEESAYKNSVSSRTWSATRSFLMKWIPQMNPGYRLGMESRDDVFKRALQCQVSDGNRHTTRSTLDWELADNMLRGFYDKDSISHVIVPVGQIPIVPWFNEVDPLVSVSTEKLVRHIRREFGYMEIPGRGKGGHRWFECPSSGFPSFPLPPKRESLSPTVLRTVAAALGYKSIRELAECC